MSSTSLTIDTGIGCLVISTLMLNECEDFGISHDPTFNVEVKHNIHNMSYVMYVYRAKSCHTS